MLKIYNNIFHDIDSIVSQSLNDNILNLIIFTHSYGGYDSDDDGCHLIRIDMRKRINISSQKLNEEEFTSNNVYLVDEYLLSVIDNDINIYDLNNLDHIGIKHMNILNSQHSNIYKFIKINNETHYIINIYTYEIDDYRNIIDRKYVIKNFNTDDILYTVQLYNNNIHVDNKIIYLPFNDCNISVYCNFLIISNEDNFIYIKLNINTDDYDVMDVNDIYKLENMFNIVDKKYYYTRLNNYKILYKWEEDGIIYDLINDTYEIIKIDINDRNYESHNMRIFIFNKKEYYIKLEENGNLEILVDEEDYFKIIDSNKINYDKMVTIGTENEKVEIPLDLLKERSYLIKSLYSDIDDIEYELISDNYTNITLYKNYIENNTYDNDNLHDLYKLCDYLQDSNINYLAEMIIVHVRNNVFGIDEEFRWLNLLYFSTCDEQLEALLYVIYERHRKYGGKVMFMEKISDKTLMLNTYIHKILRL